MLEIDVRRRFVCACLLDLFFEIDHLCPVSWAIPTIASFPIHPTENSFAPNAIVFSFLSSQIESIQKVDQLETFCFALDDPQQAWFGVSRSIGISLQMANFCLSDYGSEDRPFVISKSHMEVACVVCSAFSFVNSETSFTCYEPGQPVSKLSTNHVGSLHCTLKKGGA